MSSIRRAVSHYTILSTLLSLETTSFATLPPYSSKLQFNIIFSFTLNSWMPSRLISLPYWKRVCVFFHPFMLEALPISCYLIWSS